jgi:hypothetical protein
MGAKEELLERVRPSGLARGKLLNRHWNRHRAAADDAKKTDFWDGLSPIPDVISDEVG